MNKRIRVLVANRPRFLRELILEFFADEPDIEVVGEVREPDYDNIGTLIDQTQPEFLILGLDKVDARPPLCEALLRRHPQMKILAVADNDESSVFYWANLDIRSAPLENSETAILKTLRGGVEVPRRVM